MSIATEITRLNNNIDNLKSIKQDIKNAVNNDFNEITSEQIEDYADKIKDTFELYKDQIPDTTTTKLTRIDIDDAMVYSKNKLNTFGRTEQNNTILPQGYTQLDYIENTEIAYIDTGIIGESSWEIKAEQVTTSSTSQILISLSSDAGSWFGTANNGYWGLGREVFFEDSSTSITNINVTFESSNVSAEINNISKTRSGSTSRQNTIKLFASVANNASNYNFKGRIYKIKAIKNGEVVRNFIPCKNSNNVIGLYDLINDAFYTSENESVFIGGNNSSLPNPDYPQEIRNVEGRSCTNLFNKNGDFNYPTDSYIDATTLLEDGTIQTTANAQSNASRGLRLFLKPNTDYVVSGKLVSSTGTGYAGKARVRLMGYKTNWRALTEKNLDEFGNFSISFNSGNNSDWFLSLNALGTSGNNYVAIYDEIQINEGSTALQYEPYFEGKRLEFNVCNKNLFDVNKFEKSIVSGKILNDSGIEVTDNTSEYSTYKIPVKANQELHFQGWFQKIYLYDENQNLVLRSVSYDGATTITKPSFDLIATIDGYIGFQIYKRHYNTNKGTEQVELSSTATSYEEHKQQLIPFPLAEGQKLIEGDYLADDGVHHVRGQTVFDGYDEANRWSKAELTNGYWRFYHALTTKNSANQKVIMSNLARGITYNQRDSKKDDTIYSNGSNLGINTKRATTVAELQAIFRETPLITEYDLAEEVIESYTEAQQEAYNKLKNLMLYKGVNHIWCETDGVKPNLQLIYKSKSLN